VEAAAAETGFNLTDHVIEIDSVDELQGLDSLADQPIVFLDSLVHVDWDSLVGFEQKAESYHSLLERCTLLNTTAITEKYTPDTWRFGTFGSLRIVGGAVVDIAEKPQRLKKGKLHRRLHVAGHGRFSGKHSVKKHLSTG